MLRGSRFAGAVGLPAFTVGAALLIYLNLAPIYQQHPERLQLRAVQAYLMYFGLYFFAGASLSRLQFQDRLQRASTALFTFYLLGGLALAIGSPLLTLWLVIPVSVVLAGQASMPYLRRAGGFGDLSCDIYIYAFSIQQTLILAVKGPSFPGARCLP